MRVAHLVRVVVPGTNRTHFISDCAWENPSQLFTDDPLCAFPFPSKKVATRAAKHWMRRVPGIFSRFAIWTVTGFDDEAR